MLESTIGKLYDITVISIVMILMNICMIHHNLSTLRNKKHKRGLIINMSASKKTPSKNFNRLKQSLSSTARIQNDRLLYGKTGVSTEGIL